MNELKEARQKTGLSQQKISELLKIPFDTIHSWELGRRRPPQYVKEWYLSELQKLQK